MTSKPGLQLNTAKLISIAFVFMSVIPCSTTVWSDEGAQPAQLLPLKSRSPSALDGKRLFFNHEQRQTVISKREDDTGSEQSVLPNENALTAVNADEPLESGDIDESVSLTGRVHYQARVEGLSMIRIIVNGLPCQTIARAELAGSSTSAMLSCSSTALKQFQLQLLSDGVSVQVMNGKRMMGIITPGDSL